MKYMKSNLKRNLLHLPLLQCQQLYTHISVGATETKMIIDFLFEFNSKHLCTSTRKTETKMGSYPPKECLQA